METFIFWLWFVFAFIISIFIFDYFFNKILKLQKDFKNNMSFLFMSFFSTLEKRISVLEFEKNKKNKKNKKNV